MKQFVKKIAKALLNQKEIRFRECILSIKITFCCFIFFLIDTIKVEVKKLFSLHMHYHFVSFKGTIKKKITCVPFTIDRGNGTTFKTNINILAVLCTYIDYTVYKNDRELRRFTPRPCLSTTFDL